MAWRKTDYKRNVQSVENERQPASKQTKAQPIDIRAGSSWNGSMYGIYGTLTTLTVSIDIRRRETGITATRYLPENVGAGHGVMPASRSKRACAFC